MSNFNAKPTSPLTIKNVPRETIRTLRVLAAITGKSQAEILSEALEVLDRIYSQKVITSSASVAE